MHGHLPDEDGGRAAGGGVSHVCSKPHANETADAVGGVPVCRSARTIS